MKKIILLTIALFSLLVSCNKSNNPIDTDNGLTLLYGVKARLESGEIAEPTVSTGELITKDNGVETKLKLSYNLEERYFHKETNDYKVFIYPENGTLHELEEEGNFKTRKEFDFTSENESGEIYRYLTMQQIDIDLVDLTLMRINISIEIINKGLAKDDF